MIRKIIITLDLMSDIDSSEAGMIADEFRNEVLPDYTDCVDNFEVQVVEETKRMAESEVSKNGKKK